MASPALTTRRTLFAIAAGAALLPFAAQAAQPNPWSDLIASTVKSHPNAPKALAVAMAAGIDPTKFSGITLHANKVSEDRLPVLMFGDWRSGHYITVTPQGAFRHEAFH